MFTIRKDTPEWSSGYTPSIMAFETGHLWALGGRELSLLVLIICFLSFELWNGDRLKQPSLISTSCFSRIHW